MFIVEGNIGAGKSTLLKIIHDKIPHAHVIFEPVNRWDKGNAGKSLLADFYTNPKRWAYTLETYAMFCRVRDHIEEQYSKNVINVMERSIYSGHYCFAKNDYLSGYMTDLEWNIYQDWFYFLVKNKIALPQGFIYLRTTPELVYKRIQQRGRPSEKTISLDYVKAIHERHEEFLIKKENLIDGLYSVPVLILDGDSDFETDPVVQNKMIEEIKAFFKN